MNLETLRKEIDLIDSEIIELLNNRMELAVRSRRLKGCIADAAREQEIFDRVKELSRGLLTPEFTEQLYGHIIRESRAIQERYGKLAGFQGEHGAYSEVACRVYDPSLVPIPCREFHEVFQGVAAGRLDVGIVPVENSLEGAVTQVNDLMIETQLRIVGEISIPVHHCLLSLAETDHRNLKVVYSHPQALAQCRGFLERHGLAPRAYYDTAGAAKMLAQERNGASAVIASKLCAELYDLDVLEENIEDHPSNATRFVVLSKSKYDGEGHKCSILFSLNHEAGALCSVLKAFSDRGINLTRIESRPARTELGKYVFFADFEGSDTDEKVKEAMDGVQKDAVSFKFLGCYNSYRGEKV